MSAAPPPADDMAQSPHAYECPPHPGSQDDLTPTTYVSNPTVQQPSHAATATEAMSTLAMPSSNAQLDVSPLSAPASCLRRKKHGVSY